MARAYLTRKVPDPELRAKLTPSYPVGCKRPLQSRSLVSDVRAAERHAGDARPSRSSPNAVCAPPTVSSTRSTPSSTEPAFTPPTTSAASTCTARKAADCATTGATAPRRIWAPSCRDTRTCSRCTAPTPTGSPRSSTSSRPRPSSSAAILDEMARARRAGGRYQARHPRRIQRRDPAGDGGHRLARQLQQLLPPPQRQGRHPVPIQRNHLRQDAGTGRTG